MKKLSVVMLSVLLAFSVVACGDDDDAVGGVDFTSYGTSSLRIKNNSTTTDLIIFNGSLSKENILGGVRGGASAHGINPAKLKLKELYVVNAITYADYQKYSNNLSAAKITSSEMVYVDSDAITVDMYGDNSGNAEVYVQNTTKYHIEVRNGNFMGTTFVVARPYENMSKFVVDNEYSLYPTVVIPIKNAQGVITGTRRVEDPAQIKYYGCYAEEPRNVITFTASGITTLKPSSSVIKVVNSLTGAGGVYLLKGSQQQTSTLNRRIINEGATAVFEFQGDTGSGDKYVSIENFAYQLPAGNIAVSASAPNCSRFTNGSEYLITLRAGGASTIEFTSFLPIE